MTGKWLLELGGRDSCVESLPDWSCDLRLSDVAPAPTLQERSIRKERKGKILTSCSFPPLDLLLASPLDKSTWKKRARETSASVIGFILPGHRAGMRRVGWVWSSGLKIYEARSEARSWLK